MEDIKEVIYRHKGEDRNNIKNYFAKKQVDIKIENGYLLLIGKRNKTSFHEEIIQKYLNTIINIDTLSVVVHTGGEFNYRYSKPAINNNFGEYKIYKILDGTRISVWYDDRYILSTRKIIYANDVKWKNNQTYMEVFMDVLKHNNLSLEMFDKNKSYNVIIKNPLYHPFQQQEHEVKTIHLINIFERRTHTLVPPKEFALANKMQYQEEIEDTSIKSIEDLIINLGEKSISQYWATMNLYMDISFAQRTIY